MLFKKEDVEQNFISKLLFFIKSTYNRFKFLIITISIAVSLIIAMKYGQESVGVRHTKDVPMAIIKSTPNFLEYIKENIKYPISKKLPLVEFDIKFKHFMKIALLRNKTLENDNGLISIKGANSWFPAKLKYNNKEYDIRVRLKGDLKDHRDHPYKWSFKVKIKDGSIFQMRSFSVQHPKTRNYLAEPLILSLARNSGLLAPRSFFVRAKVNGKDIGVMNLEEGFAKELVEHQDRRYSMILKHKEDEIFLFHLSPEHMNTERMRYIADYSQLSFFPTSNKIYEDSTQKKIYQDLVGKYRSFIDNKLNASDIFDYKAMARFFAFHQVMLYNEHGISPTSTRMQYNSIIGKMEPIFYDNNYTILKDDIDIKENIKKEEEYRMMVKILSDRKIYNEYLNQIQIIANDVISGKYDNIIDDYIKNNVSHLRREFIIPDIREYNFKSILKNRSKNIANLFSGEEKEYKNVIKKFKEVTENNTNLDPNIYREYAINDIPKYYSHDKKLLIIQAFEVQKDKKDFLEIRNIMPHETYIKKIVVRNKAGAKEDNKVIEYNYPIRLERSFAYSVPKSIFIPFNKPDIDYEIIVYAYPPKLKNKIYKHVAIKHYALPSNKYSGIPRDDSSFINKNNNFIKILGKNIYINEGNYNVNEPIIIPSGYKLTINPGVVLNFSKKSFLISYSPVKINGTKKSPIILQAMGNDSWGGILVVESSSKSYINNTEVKNVSGVAKDLWKTGSSVGFYKSDVDINNLRIINNYAEDALNIISSKFKINNLFIKNTVSDGFDCDFCEGEIRDSQFYNIGKIGGDAVDVSGSNVMLDNIMFDRVSDKAISAGEQSNVKVSNVKINNSLVAFASKDLSVLNVKNSKAENINLACAMSYKKKDDFGGASLSITDSICKSNARDYVSQDGSILKVNNKIIANENLNIDDLYQSLMKKHR